MVYFTTQCRNLESELKGLHLSAHLTVETNSVTRYLVLAMACSFYVLLFVLPSGFGCQQFRHEVVSSDSCDIKSLGKKNPRIVHNFKSSLLNT